MQTKLLRGNPVTAHLTAPSDVVSGQVVAIGNLPVVAIHATKGGAVGAFAIGGGVYAAVAATGVGAPVAGSKVNFSTAITSSSAGQHFGVCLSVDDTACVVHHAPAGTAG